MCQFTARIQVKVIILNYFHWVIDEDDSGMIIISEDILEIIKDIPRYNYHGNNELKISWKCELNISQDIMRYHGNKFLPTMHMNLFSVTICHASSEHKCELLH